MADWISHVDKGMVQTRPAFAGFLQYTSFIFSLGSDFLPVAHAAIAPSGQIFALPISNFSNFITSP